MIKKIFTLIISLLISVSMYGAFTGSGTASDPYSGGTLTGNQTWDPACDTIYVSGDLTIGTGGHLTIADSLFVLFTAANVDLIITGTGRLTADGISTGKITFTADHDDDKNFGESAVDNDAGDWDERWGHISFQSMGAAGASIIDYCIIEWGDVSGYGGGIHVDFSNLTISNSIIRDNKAAWGGGIFVNAGDSPAISNCLIKNNNSDRAGGGIYCWNSSGSVIENCIFYGNRSNEATNSNYSGGGLCAQSSTSIKVLNCTFVNNTSNQTYGQSIELHSSNNARIINSIVWRWESGNEIYLNNTNNNTVVNCAVEGTGASSYVNSIDLNSSNSASDGPNFVADDGSDWSIEFISPCRDIGTDTYTGVSIPTTDYDGNNRIGTTDIGTYEIQYSRWTGTTNTTWGTATNWDESLYPTSSSSTGDVIIPSGLSNYPTASSPPNYTIGIGEKMILEPGAKVTLGTITNNGTLTLRYDSLVASSLINSSIDVPANIELYLTGGEAGTGNYKWHYISSPFNTLDTTAFTAVTLNLAQYIEDLCLLSTDQGWVAADGWIYKTGTQGETEFDNLDTGKGYNFYDNVDNEITISGQLKYGDVPVGLSFSDHGASISGFNLLGNPFPSGLDWDVIIGAGYPANTSKGLYFTRNNVQYSYIGGVGIPEDKVTGIIPPMQGFFTKTYTQGNTITLLSSARVHDDIHARYKGKTTIPLVRLSILQTVSSTSMVPPFITKDSISDETVVRFDEQAKPGLDYDFDAVKMFLSDNKLSIYSYNGETKYAINGQPFPENSVDIPLVINSPYADTLKIIATQIQGLEDYDLILKDMEQDFNINELKYNEYIFFADSGTVTDRFVLTITKQTTGLPDIFDPEQEKAFNIYSSRGILFINPVNDIWNGKRGDLRIYDITGKIVKQQKNIEWQKGVIKEISLSVPQGIYLVEICSATERYVGRVSVVR